MKYSKKKSKNHKTFWGLMLSHVYSIEKIWESLEQVVVSDEQKPHNSNMITCETFGSVWVLYIWHHNLLQTF